VSSSSNTPTPSTTTKLRSLFYPSASTSLSPSSSGAGTTLTYHLITPKLALLAVFPTAIFETKRGLVEYNVVFFREGVQEICEVEEEARKVGWVWGACVSQVEMVEQSIEWYSRGGGLYRFSAGLMWVLFVYAELHLGYLILNDDM
jgi:hypothetical protein